MLKRCKSFFNEAFETLHGHTTNNDWEEQYMNVI
jgi:hypothetical protein